MGTADADVVQSAGVSQGDDAAVVDAVVADAVVGAGLHGGRGGFRSGRVDGVWRGVLRQGAVRAGAVVEVAEGVEEGLDLDEGARLVGLSAKPFLEGLLEAFDLPAGGRVVRGVVLLLDVEDLELFLLER